MKRAFQKVGLVGAIAFGSLLVGIGSARAGGCGGGGASRGGYGGGHFFGRAAYAPSGCGSNCNMGGMQMATAQAPAASMQGMNMGASAPSAAPAAPMQGMDMGAAAPAPAPPAAPMQGMNLGAAAQPSGAAAASYTCPMHPNVVSAGPATCPYCRMALKKK